VRCILGDVRKMPWGRYTTEIRDPGQRRSVTLGAFDIPKEVARAYNWRRGGTVVTFLEITSKTPEIS